MIDCCKTRRRLCLCTTCGTISLILTIFFALALGLSLTDELFFLIIKKHLQLVPGSDTLDDWKDTSDLQVYKTFYVFHTENPDQYVSGAVPIVKEVGPFAYKKYDIKVNMRWNSDESVVTYNRDVYYIFAPEKSIGDPRDYKATILNVPLVGILSQQGRVNNFLFRILGSVLANFYLTLIGDQNLFIEKTAHEIIWGYPDPLQQVLVMLGLSDDPLVHIQTNTSDPEIFYSVNTGKKDINSVGKYIQWNSSSIVPGWNSEDARRVSGSDGQRYRPRLTKQMLKVFVEQINRHIWLAFEEEVKIHGIKMHHYRNIHTMFSNISEYPPNIGYNAYDFKYGLINETTNTPLELPLFVSKPHCLDCDPEYFKNVSGYHPDRKKHDAFSAIEPFTGIMMSGAVRGQANVRIERNTLSRQLSRVQDVTFYPWFYFSVGGTITEDKADEFKRNVQLPRLILKISVIIFLCISGTITLCIVGILLWPYCKKRWTEMKITKGYEPINGDVKNHDSANGSTDSVKIDHCNFPLLSDKNNHKDYQTMTRSLL